jgi:hypothetical protein
VAGEDLGEREDQQVLVALPHRRRVTERPALVGEVAVGEDHPLRHAGGPGGVDPGEVAVVAEARGDRREGRQGRLLLGGPALHEGVEIADRDRAGVADLRVCGTIEEEHVAQAGVRACVRLPREQTSRALGAIDEGDDAAAVGDDRPRLLAGDRRVDRHRDAAREGDRQIAERPLDAVVGEERDAVAGRDAAGVDQPRGEATAGEVPVAPGEALPDAAALEAKGRAIWGRGDPSGDHRHGVGVRERAPGHRLRTTLRHARPGDRLVAQARCPCLPPPPPLRHSRRRSRLRLPPGKEPQSGV